MMYIVEIKPEYEANCIMILGARDSHLYVTTIEVKDLEELNSDYINEHFGQLQDDAYQRGLDDAWEAARKIGHASQMKLKEMEFDFTDKDWCYNPSWYVVMNYTSSEAIAKLKAYDEKQKADDEIKVGDEVIYNNTIKCLVVRPETDERYAVLIDGNGYHHSADHRECKKTGRHFDISSILKEMQND